MNKTSTFALIAALVIGIASPVLAQSRTHSGQNASTQIEESYLPQYAPGFGNLDSGAGSSQW
jgi:hypothetical protein